jgi:hypothetical protein
MLNPIMEAAIKPFFPKHYETATAIKGRERKVYIASPYRGDTETNISNARRYARFAYERGYLPIAPHLYLPQFLNDDNPGERETALAWGLVALAACRELWVFGETISEGMAKEIREARRLRIPTRCFTADLREVTE